MIVSWDWLKQYVALDLSVDEMADKFSMSGLNHESTKEVGGDFAIDLEVTSNRPDCLGHIGVARETAAILEQEICVPEPNPPTVSTNVNELTSVAVECTDLCPRYSARVIRNVKIGPSPRWMQDRLRACGIAVINNIVDITNFVLLECGQPLHAFDLDTLHEKRIVVRRAKSGEKITAIDGDEYELKPDMCVIADADRAVAVAGIMGGLATEVTPRTTTLLIESAEFDPLSIRKTRFALGLSSEASYRFERGVDPMGVDWASRRCCELIMQHGGGELADGVAENSKPVADRNPIELRLSQIKRILGIHIDPSIAKAILIRLGLKVETEQDDSISFIPPTWRRDLEREIDLIEEIGRIHGYEHIPEDVAVPMTTSTRTQRERVLRIVRDTLVALGYSECVTLSFVTRAMDETFEAWTDREALAVDHSSRRSENLLRRSLLPSLIATARLNESRGELAPSLFEIAHVYLPLKKGLPDERLFLAMLTSTDLRSVKGALQQLLNRCHITELVSTRPSDRPEFKPGNGAELCVGERFLGYFGEVSPAIAAKFELRGVPNVMEIDLQHVLELADLIPQFAPLSDFPGSKRDLSLTIDESVPWARVEEVVRGAAGEHLESIEFHDIYRGKQIPKGKKSLYFGLSYRSLERTLTREEVDTSRQAVIEACGEIGAEVRL